MTDINCDVVVVGGSLGGVAAALAAGRAGRNVVLLSPTSWLGGQISSQGVCTPDENMYVETTGSTSSYQNFRQRIRQFYEFTYTLSLTGKNLVDSQGHLNLGQSWVSEGFSTEPQVASQTLATMLSELNVQMVVGLVNGVTLSADGSSITATSAVDPSGNTINVTATFVLDATDLGDVLPMANVEHVVGAEAKADTGEPDAAPNGPERTWIQPLTFPIVLVDLPENGQTIPKPAGYDALSAGFTLVDGDITGMFETKPLPNGQPGLIFWTYRRIIDAALFAPAKTPSPNDVATINVGSNDYTAGVIPTGDPAQDTATLAAARNLSLCYTYWLQTACPRDDGGTGYPNLTPAPNFWNTPDGISPDPYIREGRRIISVRRVLEQDIAATDANGNPLQPGPRAKNFTDSCGIGHYNIDIHANALGMQEIEINTQPFQIPLGALVPVRVTNLLPACKNLGVTHITNGAYRVHPVEWNTGESAGSLAAFCIDRNVSPQQVANTQSLIQSFQKGLVANGIPLFWWTDVQNTDPEFAAVHMLGAAGIFTGDGKDLNFNPTAPLTSADEDSLSEASGDPNLVWPGTPMTRAQAAIWLAGQLNLV